MINCKNYCILKAFDAEKYMLDECIKLIGDGIDVIVKEKYLDYSILIINNNASEVKFNEVVLQAEEILKDFIYSDSGSALEQEVVALLLEQGKKVSVAESFTGGLISSRIVNVSGCSGAFYEGLVTYGSSAKIRRLHVKVGDIEQYGIVSEQVAQEMASGLLQGRLTDYAIATTGCAGPSSDEYDTPVGLCYLCIASCEQQLIVELIIDKERNEIREIATNYALHTLLKMLKGDYKYTKFINKKI